jgi:hypothetical protein
MSDRYYLLRNNRESGPFPLGELLQQCLLPGDLVWVEGKSQNWTTPAEVPEIQEALPKGYSLSPSQRPTSKPQEHVSDRELALRAESIRRRALAALYQNQVPLHQGTPRTEMPVGPVYLRDEDAVEIIQHKPGGNRSTVAEFMLFCTLSTLAVLGWRSGIFAHLMQVRPQEASVATKLVSESANTATATALPLQADAFRLPLQRSTTFATTDTTLRADTTTIASTAAPATPKPRPATIPVRKEAPSDSGTIATAPASKPEPKTDAPLITAPDTQRETTRVNSNAAALAEKQDKNKEKELAKGFGLFRGLFKKKKKDAAAADTAAPATGG